MNRAERGLTGVWIAIGFLSLYGCSSTFPIRAYSIQIARGDPAAIPPRDISLSEYGRPMKKPYTVLGKVTTYKRGGLGAVRDLDYRSTPPEDMVERLKAPAMDMGANAVIGIYHGEYRGVNIGVEYVSGLTVQIQKEVQPGVQRTDLQVGILPVQIGKSEMGEKDYEALDRDLRAGARWFLEDKGYYAPVDPGIRFTGTVQDLEEADQAESQRLYGDETDLLLLIEVIDEQAFVPVLLDIRKVVLKTTLFSKSLGKVIWENQVINEKTTGVFWIWMNEAVTRAGAIEGVLKPLPFYSRMGTSEFVAYPPEMVKKK
ncbi:hypothetical protein [uncultured Desulfosarcina sp.]|uniref:hypothetical protein n=1 Tax=uncultured Desulfosarcina sp. TaxID=218289 RepID=UPI0029C78506|nr:hypothetical protein [uncultured Desulfosarcina sp.]